MQWLLCAVVSWLITLLHSPDLAVIVTTDLCGGTFPEEAAPILSAFAVLSPSLTQPMHTFQPSLCTFNINVREKMITQHAVTNYSYVEVIVDYQSNK